MQKINLQAKVPPEYAGMRLDRCLAEMFPDYSRSRLQDWLKSGQLTVDGAAAKAKQKILGTEIIQIQAEIQTDLSHQAEAMQLDIIYEDEDLIVINKPAGLVVHPAAGNRQGTLLNALLHHAPELADLPRAGIVHRIDKDTTGLLVIARSLSSHRQLVADLQEHLIDRQYLAIVQGRFTAGGTVHAPMARHPKQRKKMAVVHNGKLAVTHYRIKKRFNDFTLLDVQLETGRTHQIRVHMAHIQHALVGNQTYAGRLKVPKAASETLIQTLRQFKRQALHAYRLSLQHPISDETMVWEIPPQKILITYLKF